MGRIVWTQHLGGVGVERNHDQCANRVPGVARRSGNDRLMTEVNAIKDANGEKERPGKRAQFRNRSQDLHGELCL